MKRPQWTFLTAHAFVLLSIERQPDATVRDLSEIVGITERHVHRVLGDLEDAGYIDRHRDGRQNHYIVHRDRPLRRSDLCAKTIGELLDLLSDPNG